MVCSFLNFMSSSVLYCNVMFSTELFCTRLNCSALYFTVLYFTALSISLFKTNISLRAPMVRKNQDHISEIRNHNTKEHVIFFGFICRFWDSNQSHKRKPQKNHWLLKSNQILQKMFAGLQPFWVFLTSFFVSPPSYASNTTPECTTQHWTEMY